MSESLRMRVVEAGARAMWLPPLKVGRYELELAEAALDAMLDCLTENREEWITGTEESHEAVRTIRRIQASKLLAVLKEDR